MFSFLENLVKQVNDSLSGCTNATNTVVDTTEYQPITLPQQHIMHFTNTVIYCRVSSKDQNLDAQKDACIRFCEHMGLKVIDIVTEKESAYNKPQKALLNLIDIHLNCNLVVFRADRFSRNVSQCNELIQMLEAKNIILYSVKDSINLTTAYGKMNFRQLVNVAQCESETISERKKNNIKYCRQNNLAIGSPAYGYAKVDNKFVPHPHEKHICAFIGLIAQKKMKASKLNDLLISLLVKLNKDTKKFKSVEHNLPGFNENTKITHKCIAIILNTYNIPYRRRKQWTHQAVQHVKRNFNKNLLKIEALRI